MKSLKFIIYFTISSILIIGCGSKPDKTICNEFFLKTNFIDSMSGNDLTGDSVYLSLTRYHKDSIRYAVLSEFDTTDLLEPVVKKEGFYYTYTFLYQFSTSPQIRFGMYKIIYYLN